MEQLSDEELIYTPTGEPNVSYLQQLYRTTQSDLAEWLDRRQWDYDTRNCIWNGKSDDFRKHNRDSETGQVFPWEGASDQEVPEADEAIEARVDMYMAALERANVVAVPTEMNDVGQAGVNSNFMRWLINAKMKEYYPEAELAANHLEEKGLCVQYIYWNYKEDLRQKEITLDELSQQLGPAMDQFMAGEMDDQLTATMVQSLNVSEKKANAMIRELRTKGSTTIHYAEPITNQPAVRTLAPDEDFFAPAWTIDFQEVPYCFHVVHMTPEQLKDKEKNEEWDSEFVESAIEQSGIQNTGDDIYLRHRDSTFFSEDTNDDTIRVIYCYQRLIDEDGVPGIYCTVFCYGVEDKFGKHELLDYRHGKYPFVVTPLERTSKRLYASRSTTEKVASRQQALKAETDAFIDRQSITTLPPLMHPISKPPTQWGPGVKVPVLRPDQYKYADTPRYDGGSREIREYLKSSINAQLGRAGPETDPVEADAKRQRLVNKWLRHHTCVMDQVFSLYQQFGPDQEYFRVIGENNVQQYEKGKAGERYDFWVSFDVFTLGPAKVIERVKAAVDLGGALDKQGTLDTQQLLQWAITQLFPGAANQILQPVEQAAEKAVAEERNTIAELSSGILPNVRPNDAHQTKMQVLVEWMKQPDIQQRMGQEQAFKERVETHYKQLEFQLQQQQNAVIGRTGTQPTQFGTTQQGA
jgi:hypothetical protein